MAGEWHKMDCNIDSKPEVLRLHVKTGEPYDVIRGRLCGFWGWAQLNACEDGTLAGDHEIVAALCGGDVPFWEAVEAVGWVEFRDGLVVVPGWEKRFSKAAKRRASDAIRKSTKRQVEKMSARLRTDVRTTADTCPQKSENVRKIGDSVRKNPKSGGLEEKRGEESREEEIREEKNISPPSPLNATSNGGTLQRGNGGGVVLDSSADGQPGDPLGTSPEVTFSLWDDFLEAWNATPNAETWTQLRTPSDWVARASDPRWLAEYPQALEILGSGALKWFDRPMELTLFLRDYVVGKILDGGYRAKKVEKNQFGQEIKTGPTQSKTTSRPRHYFGGAVLNDIEAVKRVQAGLEGADAAKIERGKELLKIMVDEGNDHARRALAAL